MAYKRRLALLVSGGGTTARAIIHATKNGRLPHIEPACVICTPGSEFHKHAEREQISIDTYYFNPANDPDAFADQILTTCHKASVDLIGQYGWMPKTPRQVIDEFKDRMINQHPGPLDPGRPHFGGQGLYGLRVHCARLYFLRAANKHGDELWTEATAQRVAYEFDDGAVLKRKKVVVTPEDDPTTLQKRVLKVEHGVQIETLADFSEDRVEELNRGQPLIDVEAGEDKILARAIHAARLVFPKG